jgi:hypothetical protein
VNATRAPEVGQTVTCAETGKAFVITSDGFTFNYARAWDSDEILSDAGVDIRERRDLLTRHDRREPFGCYLSDNEGTITGWKGNKLGQVLRATASRSGFHGSRLVFVRVRDVHGNEWHGKGSGGGMSITLRPCK